MHEVLSWNFQNEFYKTHVHGGIYPPALNRCKSHVYKHTMILGTLNHLLQTGVLKLQVITTIVLYFYQAYSNGKEARKNGKR